MTVLLISPWGDLGGIAEHAAQLVNAVENAGREQVFIDVDSDLHPTHVLQRQDLPPVVVLNYHAAQLSQWHPAHIRDVQAMGSKVVVIYHDTGVPNSQQCLDLYAVADRFIVHEPCEDLPAALYWRMGVPAYSGMPGEWGREHYRRPILGTLGHAFGWKNWPELARLTKAIGWGVLICTPALSPEEEDALRAVTPWLDVRRGLDTHTAIETLHACDATAFVNVCHNTGQSAALLMGIAARKPVFALSTCRQYRALYRDPLGFGTIRWTETFEDLQQQLTHLPLTDRFDSGIVALAEQDSWARLGVRFADLFRSLT
jgi:hypothetical protein